MLPAQTLEAPGTVMPPDDHPISARVVPRTPPLLVDVLIIALLLVVGIVATLGLGVPGVAINATLAQHAAVVAASVLPLIARRRFPMAVLVVIVVVIGVTGSIGDPLSLAPGSAGYFALVLALYSVAGSRGARAAAAALVLALLADMLEVRPWVLPITAWAPTVPALVVACAGGRLQHRRVVLSALLSERLHLIRTQHDRMTQLTLQRARSGLAQDLEHVIAGVLTRMTARASAALRCMTQPQPGDSPDEPLAAIGDEGRDALKEMRRLLTVLRAPSDTTAPSHEPVTPPPSWVERAPQPIAQLIRMGWTLDALLVIVLSSTALLEFPAQSLIPGLAAPPNAFSAAAHVYAVAWVWLLLFRRRWPLLTAVAMSVVAFVQSFPFLFFTPQSDVIALQFAVYTVGSRMPRSRWPWLVALLGSLGLVSIQPLTLGYLGNLLVDAITLAGAAYIGRVAGEARLLNMELEQTLAAAEEAHRTAVELALRQERLALAREMHDLVAHSLSLMVVQSEAARMSITMDPAGARQALTTVVAAGERAQHELDQLLALLGPTVPTASAPIRDIAQLVGEARATGLNVELEEYGRHPDDRTASLALSVYRVVQEALTNVWKHAAGAAVRVQLRYQSDAILLSVENDRASADAHALAASGAGQGLVGMRERVALFGGTFHAGPRAGGGFAVEARIPVQSA